MDDRFGFINWPPREHPRYEAEDDDFFALEQRVERLAAESILLSEQSDAAYDAGDREASERFWREHVIKEREYERARNELHEREGGW